MDGPQFSVNAPAFVPIGLGTDSTGGGGVGANSRGPGARQQRSHPQRHIRSEAPHVEGTAGAVETPQQHPYPGRGEASSRRPPRYQSDEPTHGGSNSGPAADRHPESQLWASGADAAAPAGAALLQQPPAARGPRPGRGRGSGRGRPPPPGEEPPSDPYQQQQPFGGQRRAPLRVRGDAQGGAAYTWQQPAGAAAPAQEGAAAANAAAAAAVATFAEHGVSGGDGRGGGPPHDHQYQRRQRQPQPHAHHSHQGRGSGGWLGDTVLQEQPGRSSLWAADGGGVVDGEDCASGAYEAGPGRGGGRAARGGGRGASRGHRGRGPYGPGRYDGAPEPGDGGGDGTEYGAEYGTEYGGGSGYDSRSAGRRGGRRGALMGSRGRGFRGRGGSIGGEGFGGAGPQRQRHAGPYEDGGAAPAGAGAAAAAEAEAAAIVAVDAAGVAGGASSGSEGEGETLTCVICCEEVAAVAVGACGHSHTCARCCLRLRLCYHDLRCPLCKAVNEEVVVARPPLPPGASFDSLAGSAPQRAALWQHPRWAKGVLVMDREPAAAGGAAAGGQQGGAAGGVVRHGRPLHRSLMAMTSRSCCVCDRHGQRPFATMGLLVGHLRSAHDRLLCDVCLGAGLKFPLEYPAYDATGLAAHLASEHPRCEYCDLAFYGRDELYGHMTQRHFTCHVCSRLGRHHLYFQDADMLMVHLREEHHACEHPDCFGGMFAFATRDELTAHIRDRHSSHMPRWDQSRARPLLVDFIAARGPGAAAALSGAVAAAADGRNASGGRQRGGGRRGRDAAATDGPSLTSSANPRHSAPHQRPGLADPDAFPSLRPQQPQLPQQPQPAGLGDVHDTEGGLAVIDDDLGLGLGQGQGQGGSGLQGRGHSGAAAGGRAYTAAVAAAPGSSGPALGPGAGAGARLAGVWAGRTPGSGTFGEDFPELSAAAGGAGGGGGGAPRSAWGSAWGGVSRGAEAGSSPPSSSSTAGHLLSHPPQSSASSSLRKVTVRCPCGRRVDHLALRADEQAPPLRCDRHCVTAQRRAQLADAFGVPVTDSHVSYFDRHRTPNYPLELVQAAQAAGVEWVASLEHDLARFLADPSARRTSLAPGMSQAQRRLVHELAEHYGLASHSLGQGASRAVQLLRSPASGVPTRLLSAVAATTSPEELARLAASPQGGSGAGWVLRLVDVAPGANVHHYLRSWEGEYTLTPAPGASSSSSSPGSLLLTFSREAAFRDCCSTLAGGVRGVFRTVVERNRAKDREQPRDAGAGAGTGAGSGAGPAAGTGAGPPPAAPAPALPPGWQVLRSGKGAAASSAAARGSKAGETGAAGGARAGTWAGPAGDKAASIRAALAADAWDSGDEAGGRQTRVPRYPRPQEASSGSVGAASGGADKAAASVASAAVAAAEPRLPGRGPPLDLARDTLWSALRSEDEGEDGDGEGKWEVQVGGSGATGGAGPGGVGADGLPGGASRGNADGGRGGGGGRSSEDVAWGDDGDLNGDW